MSGKGDVPRVSALIAAYRPCAVSDAAGAFARQVVAAVSPGRADRAKALLFCASRLAAFGESVGLQLAVEVLLDGAVIERFILQGAGEHSPATRRTLRTNLRALARALERHPQPAPAALPRERAKSPYSAAEIELYLQAAQALSTPSRRMRAQALVCLGAGAGIVAGELRYIRGDDVIRRSGGMIVRVSAARARSVPVLARFHEPLAEAACHAGGRLIVGGRDPHRRNVSDALLLALSADPSLPRLQAGRLRSTWLADCAQAIGLGAFMAAAGVTCSQRLGDIASSLPALGEQEMVALLGGSS